MIIEIFEGKREIEVVPTPITPPPEDGEEEVEEEEVKRKVVVPERKIAALRIRDVKKGGEVEVLIQIDSEGGVTLVAREVGRKEGGVTKVVVDSKTV